MMYLLMNFYNHSRLGLIFKKKIYVTKTYMKMYFFIILIVAVYLFSLCFRLNFYLKLLNYLKPNTEMLQLHIYDIVLYFSLLYNICNNCITIVIKNRECSHKNLIFTLYVLRLYIFLTQ